jgi:hypothetical protein
MRFDIGTKSARAIVYGAAGVVAAVGAARGASAQGCMPLHFTTPSLGGDAVAFLHPGQVEVGVSVRRVATNRLFIGDAENEAAAPGGQPLQLRLNSIDATVTYAASYRTSFAVTLPFFYGSDSHVTADSLRHQYSNGGIGDITAIASFWLADPLKHPTGNLSIGLGVKAPTGSYHASGTNYLGNGVTAPTPLTPSVQLGDGGWSVLATGQAYQQLAGRVSAYASGEYGMSTRVHTDEIWQGLVVSVPDVYSVRAGLGFALLPDQGLSVSLGGRIDGTPLSDIIGGRDDYKRDAGYYAYVEPGVAWVTGPNQFTLSVPVRVRADYYSQFLSNGTWRVGGGGVNDVVIYAGYTRRF